MAIGISFPSGRGDTAPDNPLDNPLDVCFGIVMTPLCVVFFHVSVRAGCTCLDVGFTIVVVKNNNALSVHQVGT